MNLNKLKKEFSTKQGLLYDIHLFWDLNYLNGRKGLHITDRWRELRLVYSRNVFAKVQLHDIENVLCFPAISRMTYILKKVLF